ncbi:MAG: hypothetical protein H5T59_09660, partial [Anaerolineae bacterium]|nr:hypothetical protein [Anaerolineae bacterium]
MGVLGTANTYQGYLTDDGVPANGTYDLLFTLFNPEGVQIAGPVSLEDVLVQEGRFTALVDFGRYAFLGWERELEIAVRPGDSEGGYTTLAPRQPITAAPFALSLPGLFTVPNGFSPNVIGGFAGNEVWDGVAGGTISGGGGPEMENRVTDRFGVVGGGADNLAGDESGDPTDAWYTTVGGGGENTASSAWATVAGGHGNAAGGNWYATVGGGNANDAGHWAATVAGGEENTASASYAAVGGGWGNAASGNHATVGGGWGNAAAGRGATVAGGSDNAAEGDHSFAAGFHAKALHAGSFFWADNSSAEDFAGTRENEFLVRAMGGNWFHADYEECGLGVSNEGTRDGFRATAHTSRGNTWGAVYAFNTGTSPGVYANSEGTYAGYFADPIYVNGTCVGCTMAYVAQNAGPELLESGDVVAVSGVGEPLAGTAVPVVRVRRAQAGDAAIGVVQGRAKVTHSTKEGQESASANRAEGAAQPGDYLFLVVQGIAQAKADPAAGEIAPGQRLTAGDTPGRARPLRSQVLNGMVVAEGAPVVGIVLSAPDGSSLMPVLVTLR